MISPETAAVLRGLPPGALPVDPGGPLVTERSMGPSRVRVERFDWDGYADVVVVGQDPPAAIVVVTECGPMCVQTVMPVARAGDAWVAGPPAPELDARRLDGLYRQVSGERYEEEGGLPVMVEAQDDGRLLVVTQAHLGPAAATLGEWVWDGLDGWRFVPALTS